MIVDTHAHFTPQAMLDALQKEVGRFPSIELLSDGHKYQLAFGGGQLTRPISPKLRDADQRLEWMEHQCIDSQINGGWLDSFGYEIPADEGAAWSRFMNEFLMSGTEGIDHWCRLPPCLYKTENWRLRCWKKRSKADSPAR